MILNSNRVNAQCSKTGFTLIELLVTVSIIGILASISFKSMLEFYEQRRLRSAAIEVIGMIQERRALVIAQQLTGNDACIVLDPTNPASPINQGMVSGVKNLTVKNEAGGSPADLCFTPEGLILTQRTLVLSSPAVASQSDWCIVVTPLLAQAHLGWSPNGKVDCRFDSEGGTL
jgi:prepilin-type N-terminal cleavage/methylation domain-containing protein